MQNTRDLRDNTIADAWADLQLHAPADKGLDSDAYRLAFADPEFLLRRETRGVRFQLEMLKPDLEQQARGIDNTVVIFGSARFVDRATAQDRLAQAQAGGDASQIAKAQALLRNADHYEDARLLGRLVAGYGARRPNADRLFVCTGGGPGIMEAANRGAHEAGAPTVGLNITLPHEQQSNPYVTPELNFKFHYFALRKMHFLMRAKALVAFPGGYGTLDEVFEVMTLVQTRKAKPVPIILYGSAYWKKLLDLEFLVQEGTIAAEDLDLTTYADDPHQAWDTIKRFYNLVV